MDLAEFFGVAISTVYLWRSEQPEFSEAVKRGKKLADDMVEESLFKRATGYSHDAVKIMTRSVGDGASVIEEVPYIEHYAPDTTAAIFWLKNRRPKQWRDKQEHELTGKDGGAIETKDVTPMERVKAMASLLAQAKAKE